MSIFKKNRITVCFFRYVVFHRNGSRVWGVSSLSKYAQTWLTGKVNQTIKCHLQLTFKSDWSRITKQILTLQLFYKNDTSQNMCCAARSEAKMRWKDWRVQVRQRKKKSDGWSLKNITPFIIDVATSGFKTRRCGEVFSSQWRNIYCLLNPLPVKWNANNCGKELKLGHQFHFLSW